MVATARFRFHGSLNDFLSSDRQHRWLVYTFKGTPAIKDAVEALGVPHPEVAQLHVNGQAVDFKYLLQPEDEAEIYPVTPPESRNSTIDAAILRPARPVPARFVLDVHLGKLAKALRLLGFDSCYQNNYTDSEIATLAAAENRLVLTRDIELLKQKAVVWGYWLRSQHLQEQLTEVIKYFGLFAEMQPFTRCLACNGEIKPVAKEMVWPQLPPKTRLYFDEFYQCPDCRRVYWKGSHYEHMLDFVNRIQAEK